MFGHDSTKMIFMAEQANYQYNGMHFELKNAGVTYQRMMNKVLWEEVGEMLEVYMDDVILKFSHEEFHNQHLWRLFKRIR